MPTEPGIYRGLSMAEYHDVTKSPAISKSQVADVEISLADWLYNREHQEEPTEAMQLGTAIHGLILKEEEPYIALPEDLDRRTKDGKALYAAMVERAKAANKPLLKADQAALAEAVKESFYAHPTAPQLVSEGEPEVSLFWTDPESGLLCKSRPDWVRPDGYFVDLKTARNSHWSAFERAAGDMLYHVQAAMMEDGAKALGLPFEHVVFIALEKAEPVELLKYKITFNYFDAEAIQWGRDFYKRALVRIKGYLDTKATGEEPWTGYSYMLKMMSLKPWQLKQEPLHD